MKIKEIFFSEYLEKVYKFKGDFRVWCLTIAIYIVGVIMTRELQQDECVAK